MKSHTGSNVPRVNKVRAGLLPLRHPVKSKLGAKGNNRKSLNLAEWNVRTLLDREGSKRPERQTALVAMELSRYNIDIAALCETRLAQSGSIVDNGYTFFWSGKPENEKRESGVGFAIKKSIAQDLEQEPSPISDRVMVLRMPLQKKRSVTIVSVYAPTMTNPDENKDISPIADLDNVPSFDELTAAFASTRENKAPGSCGIPAEVWKHGGKRLQEKLHELIVDI